jgi:hypothetical protein
LPQRVEWRSGAAVRCSALVGHMVSSQSLGLSEKPLRCRRSRSWRRCLLGTHRQRWPLAYGPIRVFAEQRRPDAEFNFADRGYCQNCQNPPDEAVLYILAGFGGFASGGGRLRIVRALSDSR